MTARAPTLVEELEAQVASLEAAIASAVALISLVGVGLGLMQYVVSSGAHGLALMAMCALTAVYGFVAARVMRAGHGHRFFSVFDPLLEVSFPSVLLTAEVFTINAATVQASSASLTLYGVSLALAVMRLRTVLPLVVGIIGGVQYVAVFWWVIYPRMAPEIRDVITNPWMIASRGIVIATAGFVGSLVSVALRRAFANAHRDVRSKDLFGKYRLGTELAKGGMGNVFRATYCPEGGFARPVAIKRIHAHLAQEESFVAAFRDEAQLCSYLTHPNIVQVFDFGQQEDTYFLAMEFVEGHTLQQLLKRCLQEKLEIPPRLVAFMAHEICAGLVYAHSTARDEKGALLRVIHRDLSPSNVLISRTGQVKITDFGVAKALRDSTAAHTSTVAGKLAYMAPEQTAAAALDPRCDVFAAGIMIWEMLAARPLFARGSDAATLRAVLEHVVEAPSSLRTDLVAPGWDASVIRALQRPVERRHATAQELLTELTAIMQAEGVPAPQELPAFLARVFPVETGVSAVSEMATRPVVSAEQAEAPTVRVP